MKLRTRDSRTEVLLNQSLWTTIRYNLYHPVINNTYYFLLAALPLQQTFFCLPLYRFNKMAPLPGIGFEINRIAMVLCFKFRKYVHMVYFLHILILVCFCIVIHVYVFILVHVCVFDFVPLYFCYLAR